MDLSRTEQINGFLSALGWGQARQTPVPGDASARRYMRLDLDGQKAVLMDAPPALEDAIGYTAEARLAGTNPNAFVGLAMELTRRGFSAPRILGSDLEAGLILMEDLGGDRVAEIVQKTPALEPEIYTACIDTLAAIYRSSFIADMSGWHVGDYDETALLVEADLFVDWYAPAFDTALNEKARDDWTRVWTQAFGHLNAHAPGLALRDFHAENIFWLPERQASANIGLIDFQDALFAHPSYDLVSLLEDARRDVDPDLITPLISRFCQNSGIIEDGKFHAAYAVQAAQRNAKILGIFVRLAKRDNKPHYLDMIPRVAAHFCKDLSHPALTEILRWIEKNTPSILEVGA